MNPNPYQAPLPVRPDHDLNGVSPAPNRLPFVLAAIGAGLASAYWAALTLLLGFAASSGSVSGFQVILPCVLIVLYAVRGVQIFRGDATAAKRVLWLHGVGGAMALVQIFSGSVLVIALQGVKLAIHVFGALTAHLAGRAFAESQAARARVGA